MQLSIQAIIGFVVAAGLAVASELPSPMTVNLERRKMLVTKNDTVDFKAVRKQANALNYKYDKLLRNFRKNTGRDHPLLHLLLDLIDKRDGKGNVDLDDIGEGQLWAGDVQFGQSKFKIDFDTGSADTLVNPFVYFPHRSKSSRKTHHTFSTAYGDGTTASGFIYTDDLKIGGYEAKDVAIGLSVTKFINDEDNQGIAGMSFPAVQSFPKKFDPFFIALVKQKVVPEPVFQFTLKRGSGSTLHLGGIDNSRFQGELSYVDVNPEDGFWISEGKVNGKKIDACIDTGSSIIFGPIDEVREVITKMDGVTPFTAGGALHGAFDCSKPPKLDFEFAGQKFNMGENQVSFGKYQGQCVLSIMGQKNLPMNAWVVGDSFLQTASVVFDMGKNRMGFAPTSN